MRFCRFPDLRAAGVPFRSRIHIQSKGQFPRRVRLGANTASWPAHELVLSERTGRRRTPWCENPGAVGKATGAGRVGAFAGAALKLTIYTRSAEF
jgi:hypothetical protein